MQTIMIQQTREEHKNVLPTITISSMLAMLVLIIPLILLNSHDLHALELIVDEQSTNPPPEDEFSDFDEEFSELDNAGSEQAGEKLKENDVVPSPFIVSIKQFVSLNTAHSSPESNVLTDHRGLSSALTSLEIEYDQRVLNDWRLVAQAYVDQDWVFQSDAPNWSRVYQDQRETELDVREFYLSGKFSIADVPGDIWIGRKTLTWGSMDALSPFDKINPRNLEVPGVMDFKTMKLPVGLTQLSVYQNIFQDEWNFDLVAIHESRLSKTSVFGSDFYPFPIENKQIKPDSVWEGSFEDHQWAVRVQRIGEGFDIGWYWLSTNNDGGHVEFDGMGVPNQIHERVNTQGFSFATTSGSFGLKFDLAYESNLQWAEVTPIPVSANEVVFASAESESFDRIHGALGLDYNGIKNTEIMLEISGRQLQSYQDWLEPFPLEVSELGGQWVGRISHKLLNERLTLDYIATSFGWESEEGMIHRLVSSFDWSDSINMEAGYIHYVRGGNGFMKTADQNHRVFGQINWVF